MRYATEAAQTAPKYPAPAEADFSLKNYAFESGEKLPELKLLVPRLC